jgi:hypothetical protein
VKHLGQGPIETAPAFCLDPFGVFRNTGRRENDQPSERFESASGYGGLEFGDDELRGCRIRGDGFAV